MKEGIDEDNCDVVEDDQAKNEEENENVSSRDDNDDSHIEDNAKRGLEDVELGGPICQANDKHKTDKEEKDTRVTRESRPGTEANEKDEKCSIHINEGTDDAVGAIEVSPEVEEDGIPRAKVTKNLTKSSCDDSVRSWEGLPVATPVPDTQQNTATSLNEDSNLHWWERLPVATPIFDAEVEVWDYGRPTYPDRFGKGFLGGRPAPPPPSDRAPRDPLFTEEDYANPFRCICKIIGIMVTLPFYLIYMVLCDCRWIKPCCRLMDCSICRPIGMIIDASTFLISNVLWLLYTAIFVPTYTIMIYVKRAVWNILLCFIKAVLIPVECIALQIIRPTCRGIATLCNACFKFVQGISVACCQGLKAIFLYALSCVRNSLTCVLNSLIRPIYTSILSCGNAVHNNLLLPIWGCLESILREVCNGIKYLGGILGKCLQCLWRNIVVTSYNALAAFLKSIYEHAVLPVGRGIKYVMVSIWKGVRLFCTSIWKGVRLFCTSIYQGFVLVWKAITKCVGAIQQNIFVPICKGIQAIFSSIFEAVKYICKIGFFAVAAVLVFVSTIFECIWNKILVPAATGFVGGVKYGYSHILVPMGQFVYGYVIRPIVLAVKAVAEFIGAILSATKNAVVSVGSFCHQAILIPAGHFARTVGLQIGVVFQALSQQIRAMFETLAGLFK